MHNLSKHVDCRIASAPAAAATTDVTGTAIDTQGYDGVLFVAHLGTITSGAVTSLKAQQSSDDGDADAYADLAGSGTTIPDSASDKLAILDVYRPQERYVKPILDRGTQNAVLNGMIAILYKGRSVPVSLHANVAVSNLVVSPAEGTA